MIAKCLLNAIFLSNWEMAHAIMLMPVQRPAIGMDATHPIPKNGTLIVDRKDFHVQWLGEDRVIVISTLPMIDSISQHGMGVHGQPKWIGGGWGG